jgi:hypothetical protein
MAVTKSYNNGVFISETKFPNISLSHLDEAHIMYMNRGNEPITDLGILEPFIKSGYMSRKPIFVDALKPSSVMYVEPNGRGSYSFKVPVPATETYLVEDISGMDKPGLDGQEFDLRFNKKFTGKTAIIKFALSDDVEFYVVDFKRAGTNWDYTLRVNAVDAKHKYVPKQHLRPGQRVYISTSASGEYNTVFNEINEGGLTGGGFREFHNYVGSATANVHTSITRDGAFNKLDNMIVGGINDYADMLTITEFLPGTLGYLNNMQDQGMGKSPMDRYMQKYNNNQNKALEAIKRESVRSILPKIEYIMKQQILSDASTQAMWGTGGAIKVDGGTTAHLPVGLWFQLQKGNYFTYNISDFSLEYIENKIMEIWGHKVNPYESKMVVTVKTGRGGYDLAVAAISERHKNRAYMVMDKDFTEGSGFKRGLMASEFNHYEWAYGIIQYEVDNSFDPTDTDLSENPRLPGRFGGNRLSSYVFMIADASGKDDNIVEVRKKDHWDFAHYVHQGKLQYPIGGGLAGVNGGKPFVTGNPRVQHGFEVFMEMPHRAMFMKDPSKTIVIRPFNVETGRALYSTYFD